MVDNKGETTSKKTHQHLSTSPEDHHDQEPSAGDPPQTAVSGGPLPYVSPTTLFETTSVTPKRPRYAGVVGSGQWKPISQPNKPPAAMLSSESTPSPSANPQPGGGGAAASSTNTAASSPSNSPTRPSLSGGQETTKPSLSEMENFAQQQQQFRKGKYVSPVWKPNEMLWLARAWRIQYQGGASGSLDPHEAGEVAGVTAAGRGKTRAEKDREVAEFLNRHGVNRDAKTAGTKWDNMLGEFRKVYEWERGGEREQLGKSYFRLSPYERKIHRLPASFDEQVFEELSQYMGPRVRIPQPPRATAGGGDPFVVPHKSLPPPHPYREEELSLSRSNNKELMVMGSGGGGEGLLGFERATLSFHCSSGRELRRIGKIRMIWEESVSVWAEEGEHHRGRVKVVGSSFLNADELAFLDDSMVASTMETFEDGPLKGFSVDRFISGQHLKVFGRRRPNSNYPHLVSNERFQMHSVEPSIRSITSWEYQDPTEYYVGCLRVPPPTLPCLFELSWYLQEPPPEELRFPLRKDVYKDLPQGKELFFTTSNELLDCRAITCDILNSVTKSNPTLSTTSRDSFIGLWDDCINRTVTEFCSQELVQIRKSPSSSPLAETVQDQWPNVTGFIRNLCLWRGEEVDQMKPNLLDPTSTIAEKIMWTYGDIPYVLGYYAVGYVVTFCALSRLQDRVIRTDILTVDLSTPSERLKALVPCWRIAGLLPLLADRCVNGNVNGMKALTSPAYGDFERTDFGNGNITEMTPNTVIRYFSSKRKWGEVKEIYDFLDHRIPHAEYLVKSSEKELALVFNPRGCKVQPLNVEQLLEALKNVTKALVALHDLSFMHRNLGWDKVARSGAGEWFVTGFEEAVGAPQINAHANANPMQTPTHAPEMSRGLHGVKVDVWGVGQLVRTCGLVGVPKLLRELEKRCLEHNPEHRPTAADCYHHLSQLQSSLSAAAGAGSSSGVASQSLQ